MNCDYENTFIDQVPVYSGDIESVREFGTEYCIFDLNHKITRKLNLNDLDSMIDTEEEWNDFISSLRDVDQLVLYTKIGSIENTIIRDYRDATIKAYIFRLKNSGINTEIFLNNNMADDNHSI